jgi:formylglycine-generating enzyme required for sulfatase activity
VRAGSIGALIVVAGGIGLSVLLLLKDQAQLGRANRSYEDGRNLLSSGKTAEARVEFQRALDSSLLVGGITGKRPVALELAADARRALRTCDALETLKTADAGVFAALDAARKDTGPRALKKDEIEKLEKKRLAQLELDVARALEKLALEADKLPGDAGRTKAENHEIAERAYEVAAEGATAGGFDWVEPAKKGAGRAKTRALVASALAANEADEGSKAHELAEAALKVLEGDPFDDEKERNELRAATRGIFAEGIDRDKVNDFEKKVAALEARVTTNDLGAMLPEIEATAEPALEGGHRAAAGLEAKKKVAVELLAKVKDVAKLFTGMVLAKESGETKLYVDKLEVTSDAFKAWMDEKKPYTDGRTAEAWGSEDAAKLAENFLDSTVKTPGPATWANGSFPEGLGNHPVAGVSPLEAAAFARARGKRLPTKEEWLAAAGSPDGTATYPWGESWADDKANVKTKGTQAVGSFPSGAAKTGALDMIGNVREIVQEADAFAVMGGSYNSKPETATLKSAIPVASAARPRDQGFRCARELQWKR